MTIGAQLYKLLRGHQISRGEVVLLSAGITLNVFLWPLTLFILRGEGPIILRYDVLLGTEYLSAGWDAFKIPLSALLAFGINVGIWLAYRLRERYLAYFFAATALATQLVFLVALITLLFINA